MSTDNNEPTENPITRRQFAAVGAAGLAASSLLLRTPAAMAAEGDVGPMVGHVSTNTANIWYRPAEYGEYTAQLIANRKTITAHATSRAEEDGCVVFTFEGLEPATRYAYRIQDAGGTDRAGDTYHLDTPPDPTTKTKVCLAFGSCAHSKPLKLWSQMADRGAQGLVLLGDTPYIDSTKLAVARGKHRDFLRVPELANLIHTTPTWGTWDDHDFGKNDSDGTLPGKGNARQAFVEYRANAEYGHAGEGIYTKFRYGPVEVFVLDTRWFARTEPSPFDPSKPTLLGAEQWKWLKAALLESTAPFKLITCGMIWDDKENSESDDWGTYSHERNALFQFLGDNKISGAVLIGGDIHCSRLLQYKTEEQVGYPIRQFIVSPIHDSTIPSLNVAHPDLVRGEAVPHVWMRLEVDSTVQPPTLHAEWVQMDGQEMWDITLTEDELTP